MLGRTIAWVTALACLAACDGGVRLGTPCTYTSECAAPLACVFGRCREECAGARDCDAPAECLRTPSGIAACSIAADDRCERDDACASGLRCVGGACRQACADAPCAPDMTCAADDVCVRADAPVADAGTADAGGDAGECTGDPCDPVADCGCSGGERCAASAGALACVASGGALGYGAACTTSTECVAGHGCHGGRCLQYCGADQDCAADDVTCSEVHGATGVPPGVELCSDPCDPIADTGCPAGGTCTIIIGAGGSPFTECREIGAGAIGTSCTNNHDCVAHAVCDLVEPTGSDRVCYAFCDPTGGACAGGQPCEPYRTIRGQSIGVCRDPT